MHRNLFHILVTVFIGCLTFSCAYQMIYFLSVRVCVCVNVIENPAPWTLYTLYVFWILIRFVVFYFFIHIGSVTAILTENIVLSYYVTIFLFFFYICFVCAVTSYSCASSEHMVLTQIINTFSLWTICFNYLYSVRYDARWFSYCVAFNTQYCFKYL